MALSAEGVGDASLREAFGPEAVLAHRARGQAGCGQFSRPRASSHRTRRDAHRMPSPSEPQTDRDELAPALVLHLVPNLPEDIQADIRRGVHEPQVALLIPPTFVY